MLNSDGLHYGDSCQLRVRVNRELSDRDSRCGNRSNTACDDGCYGDSGGRLQDG